MRCLGPVIQMMPDECFPRLVGTLESESRRASSRCLWFPPVPTIVVNSLQAVDGHFQHSQSLCGTDNSVASARVLTNYLALFAKPALKFSISGLITIPRGMRYKPAVRSMLN